MSDRPFWKTPWPYVFFAGVIILTLIRPLMIRRPDPPPVLNPVGSYELIDQNGNTFGSENLKGKPYIASFFFTSCPSICPPLMRAVSSLEERYRQSGIEDIEIISITVNPEVDSPDKLRDYANQNGFNLERWHMLTGPPETIEKVILEQFRTPLSEPSEVSPGIFDIAHTGKLLLVDPEGNLRGYYDSDEQGLDETFHRSLHVRAEHKRNKR